MRSEILEGLIIGGMIGLAVVAIRTLLLGQASLIQALVLATAGIVLCGVQIVLSLRRARFRRPLQEQPEPSPPTPRRRLRRKNPFAYELTHNWTGLDDRLSKQQPQSSSENEHQADEPKS
jgi:hypothetical protein